MPKFYKKMFALLSNTLLVIFVVIGLALAVSMFPGKNIYKLLAVRSGSMEPTINTGSLVVVVPTADYKEGDIISFKPDRSKTDLESVTHRLISIEETALGALYATRGDANDAVDGDRITKQQVMGKVVLSIPFLGKATGYLKTLQGLIILIIIPSMIIIYEEVNNIKNETKSLMSKKHTKQNYEELAKGENENI